ncbi:olfactory receptor 2M5, partial [Silurus meridionalis]
MSLSYNSTNEVSLVYSQILQVVLTGGLISKVIFVILMSMFFTYLNAIMFYTLCSKSVFKETPRYILFNHMLINDSIQLIVTAVLYILILAYVKLVMAACVFIVFVLSTTFRNTPLNLALMSLERYVSVHYPLRHAEIATQKRMYMGIGIIWFLGLVHFIIDLLYVAVTNPKILTSQIFCTRDKFFVKQWQIDVYQAFNIFYFVSVSLIILFTYISILITARSVSSNKDSAVKAHKTIMLHLVQLGLCLTSFLYSFIEQAVAMAGNSSLFRDIRYLNYLFLLILPRCLSPLIYGLRDDVVRPLFIYYFRCATGKRKSAGNVH